MAARSRTDLTVSPLLRGTFLGSEPARAVPLSAGQSPLSALSASPLPRPEDLGQGISGAVGISDAKLAPAPRGVRRAPPEARRAEGAGGGISPTELPAGARPPLRPLCGSTARAPPMPVPARPGHGADERGRHYTRARPARLPSDRPRPALPGAGDKHKRRAMPERGPSGRGHGAFRAIFYLRESWRSSPFCAAPTTPRRNWLGPAASATRGRHSRHCAGAAAAPRAEGQAPPISWLTFFPANGRAESGGGPRAEPSPPWGNFRWGRGQWKGQIWERFLKSSFPRPLRAGTAGTWVPGCVFQTAWPVFRLGRATGPVPTGRSLDIRVKQIYVYCYKMGVNQIPALQAD